MAIGRSRTRHSFGSNATQVDPVAGNPYSASGEEISVNPFVQSQLNAGLVPLGDTWVTPAERDAAIARESAYQTQLKNDAAANSAYNSDTGKYDATLIIPGVTRGGEPVAKHLSFDTADQYLAFRNNGPTDTQMLGYLTSELKNGVDIAQKSDGSYLTVAFDSPQDVSDNAQKIVDRYASVIGSDSYLTGKSGFLSQYEKIPGFSKLTADPLLSRIGIDAYDKSAVTDLLSKYSIVDASSLGDDVISKALKNGSVDMGGGQLAVNNADAEYYKSLSDAANASRIGYYGLNSVAAPFESASVKGMNATYPSINMTIDGKSMVYVPYEAGARTVGRKSTSDPNDLMYLTGLSGNEDVFKYGQAVNFTGDTLNSIKSTMNSSPYGGTYSVYETPGLGYLFTPDDYSKYALSKQSGLNSPFAITAENASFLNTGRGSHSFGDLIGSWLTRDYDPATGASLNLLAGIDGLPSGVGATPIADALQSAKWFSQGNTDKNLFSFQNQNGSWSQWAFDQWVERSGGGGLFGSLASLIGPVLSLINPVAGMAFSGGFGVSQGLINGNPLQALSGALGLSSAFGGFSFGNILSDTLSSTPGLEFLANDFVGPLSQTQSAIQGAITSGTNAAIGSGALIGDVLPGLIAGGVGGAVNGSGLVNSASQSIGDAFGVVDPVVQNAITSGVNSAIGSATLTAINGGSFGDILENALVGGVAGGVGNYVTNEVRGALNGVPSEQAPAPVETVTPTEVNPDYGTLGSGTNPAFTDNYTDFGVGGFDISGSTTDTNPFSTGTVDLSNSGGSADVVIDPNSGVDTSTGATSDTVNQYFGGNEVHGEYNNGIYFNPDLTNTISGAAGGAAAGATGAVLTGGDIGNGILTGALAGGAGGLASDLGVSAPVSGAVSNVTGNVVNSALQDTGQTNGSQTQATGTQGWVLGLGFGDLLPQFRDLTKTRADMKWGTRLSGRP